MSSVISYVCSIVTAVPDRCHGVYGKHFPVCGIDTWHLLGFAHALHGQTSTSGWIDPAWNGRAVHSPAPFLQAVALERDTAFMKSKDIRTTARAYELR